MSAKDDRARDVQDVMREERGRGRRPVDTDALRERSERLETCRELLQYGNEADVVEAMRGLGVEPGSKAMRDALQIWRASR